MKQKTDEQQVLAALKNGKLKRTKNNAVELRIAQEAAKQYFRKDARISIRLSSADLRAVKRIAADEGLPYQTLIASVIHKFTAKKLGDV